MIKPVASLAERFFKKTIPEPNSGCLLWTGWQSHGYGLFVVHNPKTPALAHRVAWELANGAIPPGLLVCHRCDTRPCVNVDHLFLGTARDNSHDARAKGRLRNPSAAESHARQHCKRGHLFDAGNTLMTPVAGGRIRRACRACMHDKYIAKRRRLGFSVTSSEAPR